MGAQPLANSYLTACQVAAGAEARYPLHARVCTECWLIQVDDVVPAKAIFNADYAYFSSYSRTWVEHARRYAESMSDRLKLGPESLVIEVASNDGYLLQHFVAMRIPVLGIEPTTNTAEAARARGVRTEVLFFDEVSAAALARRGVRADLIVANNVLAHVPDIAGFVGGFRYVLKDEGVLTFEFPHVLNLINKVQFDTIYHEHFSYLSLLSVEPILRSRGLRSFDVELIPTHGGSLRLFCGHVHSGHQETSALAAVRDNESTAELDRLETYRGFAPRVKSVRRSFRDYLAGALSTGRRVTAYGAAAKGNTFLNYCGVSASEIIAVLMRDPAKQGRFLPGSHIPIHAPEHLLRLQPDDVVILPWKSCGGDYPPTRIRERLGRAVRPSDPVHSDPALMRFYETALAGVIRVVPEPQRDERGAFVRLHCPLEFDGAGFPFAPTQTSLSRNPILGTLRGLHYHPAPDGEVKLVRAVRGCIFDVALDLRPQSARIGLRDRLVWAGVKGGRRRRIRRDNVGGRSSPFIPLWFELDADDAGEGRFGEPH